MAKKNKPRPPKVVNTTPTYEVGQKLILTDERTMMEKCTIAKVQETGYVLSNGIEVNFDLNRTGKQRGHCLIETEETHQIYEAYYAHQRATRALPDILDIISKWDKMNLSYEQSGAMLRIDRYINKIKSTLDDYKSSSN